MAVKFVDEYTVTLGPASYSTLCACGEWIHSHADDGRVTELHKTKLDAHDKICLWKPSHPVSAQGDGAGE